MAVRAKCVEELINTEKDYVAMLRNIIEVCKFSAFLWSYVCMSYLNYPKWTHTGLTDWKETHPLTLHSLDLCVSSISIIQYYYYSCYEQGYLDKVRAEKNLFTAADAETIFGNIEELYNFHREFLKELQQAVHFDRMEESIVGHVFIKYVGHAVCIVIVALFVRSTWGNWNVCLSFCVSHLKRCCE